MAAIAAFALLATPLLALSADARRQRDVPLEVDKPASIRPWYRYKVDSQGSTWPQTDWKGFNSIALGNASPPVEGAPKTQLPIQGDAERGRNLAYDRARGGSCVVCHVMGKTTPAQPGNVGPDLSTVGAKRTDEWLFNYVYDPRIYNAGSIMPPWGAYKVFSLDEIRDIVAFLKTLREPYAIADKSENPNTRGRHPLKAGTIWTRPRIQPCSLSTAARTSSSATAAEANRAHPATPRPTHRSKRGRRTCLVSNQD